MTTQTKQILSEIHSELDQAVPGWRAQFTNFGAVMKALAGDERGAKARELVKQYRTVQQQLYRAIPSLPKVDGGVRDSGDTDVSIFDATPTGHAVRAETTPAEYAGSDPFDDDGEPVSHVARTAMSEDSLFHPEEPRTLRSSIPDKGAPTLVQRVRQRIGYDWRKSLSVFPSAPPRLAGCY